MRGARLGWAALAVVVLIVGGLWLADRAQADAQQRWLAEQQQFMAQATATTRASDTQVALTAEVVAQASSTARMAAAVGTVQAEATAADARILAEATPGAAQLATYRKNLDATVTTGQISARATNTALTRR